MKLVFRNLLTAALFAISACTAVTVKSEIIFDCDLGQSGCQAGDTVISAVPGSLAGFAVYSQDSGEFDVARIEIHFDSGKASVYKTLTRPVIVADTFDINGADDLFIAHEDNVFEYGGGSFASLNESGGPGNHSQTIVRRRKGTVPDSPALLCYAAFRLSADCVWPDTLDVGVTVELSSITHSAGETASGIVRIAPAVPEAEIVIPAAGEILYAGQKADIVWESENTAKQTLCIDFSQDGGLNWTTIADDVPAGFNRFEWEVPVIESVDCLLRLRNSLGMLPDQSASAFSIEIRPQITAVTYMTAEGKAVDVHCSVSHPAAGTVPLSVSYSLDEGAAWYSAALDRDLSGIAADGSEIEFIWDAFGDAGYFTGTAQLRIAAENDSTDSALVLPVMLDYNERPVIAGESSEFSDGAVSVSFTVSDREGDSVTVRGEYSTDSGMSWHPATLAGQRKYGSESYSSGAVRWLSWPDFPGEYCQAVLLRIIPADFLDGEPLAFGPFTVDNTGAGMKGSVNRYNPGGVPVFAFHNIEYNNYDNAKLSLTPVMFERMVQELADFGYETLSMNRYMDYIEFGKPVPARSVLLTFDDGYLPLYTRLFPILEKYGCRASIGLITAKLNHMFYLSHYQIKIMHDSGLADFQSHSWNLHRIDNDVARVDRQRGETEEYYKFRVGADLKFSYDSIVSITGEAPAAFITPYGHGNEIVESIARDAGFRSMFYIGNPKTNGYGDYAYHLDRISLDRPLSKVAVKLAALGYYSGGQTGAAPLLNTRSTEGPLPDIVVSTKLPGQVLFSSPAIDADGLLYIGSWDGKLYCISPDGDVRWSRETGDGIVSSPAVGMDGSIYACSYDRYLYKYDQDGSLRWQIDCWDPVFSSPAVTPAGDVYVGSTDGGLVLGRADGTVKINYRTGDMVISSPAIGPEGTIYCGTWNNRMLAMNPDGSLKWQKNVNTGIESSPALDGQGRVLFGALDGMLYALDDSGKEVWSLALGGRIESSPVIGPGGDVYIGCADGCLYAVSPDGRLLWRFATGGSVESTAAVDAEGRIYFGSRDGCLYALDADGSLLWRFASGGFIDSSPTISGDGILYIASSDSYLYGFDIGSPLADSPWPKFRGNSMQNGLSPSYASARKPAVADAADNQSPREFRLNDPFPNPFNPVTSVTFEMPVRSQARLAVYNTAGQLVDELVSGVLEAGNHGIMWNAGAMPSGLYFLSFKAGEFSATKKVTLLK